jgi:hypothetical protein
MDLREYEQNKFVIADGCYRSERYTIGGVSGTSVELIVCRVPSSFRDACVRTAERRFSAVGTGTPGDSSPPVCGRHEALCDEARCRLALSCQPGGNNRSSAGNVVGDGRRSVNFMPRRVRASYERRYSVEAGRLSGQRARHDD